MSLEEIRLNLQVTFCQSVAFILLQQCSGVSKHTIFSLAIALRLLGHLLVHCRLVNYWTTMLAGIMKISFNTSM